MAGEPHKDDTITFGKKGLSPEEVENYRAKISKAQSGVDALKGSTPVGTVERPQMPDFGALQSMKGDHGATGLNPEGGVSPRPQGSPVISPQTAAQLGQLNAAQAAAQARQAKNEENIKKEIEEAKDDAAFDGFDFMAYNEAEKILNNKKRRLDIEGRCQPMSLEDLIIKDEVSQIVPIVPGKFEATFRTMNPEESLFVKQYLAKEQAPNESYALEKFSLCQLCCSLVSINGTEFPDHRRPDGSPDEELFKAKLKRLMKKSAYVISDLGLNFIWFDMRVRKLLSPDKLGNG